MQPNADRRIVESLTRAVRQVIGAVCFYCCAGLKFVMKMGTAGLNVKRLAMLLRRIKVDCNLVDGDESQDHCVLRLSSLNYPERAAFIEYINQGVEPRLAGIKIEPAETEGTGIGQPFLITEEWFNLSGERNDDPEKIVELVEQTFLKQ